MMQLDKAYNREDFLSFLGDTFLTDFKKDIRPANTQGFFSIQKASSLGRSESLDLQVFEFEYLGSASKRVSLTKEAFQIMKQSATFTALAVFFGTDTADWRFSFLTANPQRTEKGKVTIAYSNPRRYSFFLGPNAKIKTPNKFLISRGTVGSFEDLKSRFSIEVVNKEFYKEISRAFSNLVDGLLKLPQKQDMSQTNLEFAVRLIGRVIFCWFLREKKSESGISLMPNELLSLEAVKINEDYYHKIMEPIFFEVLNKPLKSRLEAFINIPFYSVPYLNGGLFTPRYDDYYKRTGEDLQSQFHNTLIVPDSWFEDFFETLETYNFTIDENTSFDEELSIDPEMLGRIFENLLAEINPETGGSARKATGSYYTPRPIVSYMVDESLLLYLKQKTNIEENKLRALISYDLIDDSEYSITQEDKEKILDALENLKLLDPACGSGAFPIGALQKIVFVLQQIDPDGQLWLRKQLARTSTELRRVIEREFEHQNFDYIRKLGIIRENIYGIDIQPIATEISRLRCFLTLVVDERVLDELENRGIEPLPNLDFKFVTANSLIGLPSSRNVNQMGLFEDDQGIKELKELRDMFFTATGAEREQLKLQFVQAQNKMFQRMIEGGTKGYADLTSRLSGWDPFSHKASTWFDPEWMFGIKEGFDIVIANPPYISFQEIEVSTKNIYKENFESAKGKYDIYLLFIEKAFNLVKDSRFICYIVPNKFIRSNYGVAIKSLILKNRIIEIINFNDIQVFDAVTNYTCILCLQKGRDFDKPSFIYKNATSVLNSDISWDIHMINQSHLSNDIWVLGDNEETEIISKIKIGNQTLEDFSHAITQGMRTGQLKVFFENINCSFVEKNNLERELLAPILHGKNTKRYYLSPKINDLILFPYQNDHKTPVNIDNFPNAKKYLEEYKEALLSRKDSGRFFNETGKYWYEYWDPKPICFSSPKIIFPDISNHNQFCLETQGLGYLNTCYGILLKDRAMYKSILAILNSSLIEFFIKKISPSVRGGFHRYKTSYIKRIPIPKLNHDTQLSLEKLVDIILKIGNDRKELSNIEEQIDQIVYELYGLTKEEILIVERAFNG